MQRFAHTPHRSARRKVWAPGLAALLVALVAGGCTAGGSSDGSPSDAKQGDPTLSLPAPGKYATLLEPCGAVPASMLEDLLPGISSLSPDQQERALQGTPAVTYDTDRRVGCSWKADAPDSSHRLSLDIERVVSYDTSVSDAQRAQQVYARELKAAHIPASGSPSPPSTGDETGSGSPSDTPDASDAPNPSGTPNTPGASDSTDIHGTSGTPRKSSTPNTSGTPSGSPSGSGGDLVDGSDGSSGDAALAPGLQPRRLTDLGDEAYVDDVLSQSGSATRNRTVSVVFRTSNVIVTITYTAQPTHADEVPDSKELQDRAQALAKKLTDEFDQ
ncbi:DUF3558 domain-containing protein [Streptomyces fuscigenes]|uniref:DUF3558 domain-containing protein n=1 Tax=Streptomyces fuscigenes TaxID=1528880 RepID=UPI001F37AF45|nr:DUF3558 domain-containing protein [Streptomyces fuscigenes]MCF3961065.1 DUF3558 domain-containing protein [Streptomyces fuscigenes]